jgi:hypothetical protein
MNGFSKGVFCLEGDWWNNLKQPSSIEPILQLVDQQQTHKRRHIHCDVATREEFFFFLKKWSQKAYRSHPILYLGFHGEPGQIYLGAMHRSPAVTLKEIADALEGKCDGRVFVFGSCETVKAGPWSMKKFLERTQALAVCGYAREIAWMQSAALDLLILTAMQEATFTLQGIGKIDKLIRSRSAGLCRELGFRIVTRPPK